MERILVIVMAVLATIAYFFGRDQGKSDQKKVQSAEAEKYEGEVADAEYEAEASKPVGDRFSSMRERIKRRRGL